MQQTRLDNWLRRRFSLETHVFTFTMPASLPRRARIRKVDPGRGGHYQFEAIIRRQRDVDALLASLKKERQNYSTKVVTRRGFLARTFDPPGGQSFTYRLIWFFLMAAVLAAAIVYVPWKYILTQVIDAVRYLVPYF